MSPRQYLPSSIPNTRGHQKYLISPGRDRSIPSLLPQGFQLSSSMYKLAHGDLGHFITPQDIVLVPLGSRGQTVAVTLKYNYVSEEGRKRLWKSLMSSIYHQVTYMATLFIELIDQELGWWGKTLIVVHGSWSQVSLWEIQLIPCKTKNRMFNS
jgi:hypothetical protein